MVTSIRHTLHHPWLHHKSQGPLGHGAVSTRNYTWPLSTVFWVCFWPITLLCFYLWLSTTTGSCAITSYRMEGELVPGASRCTDSFICLAVRSHKAQQLQMARPLLCLSGAIRWSPGYQALWPERHQMGNAFTGTFCKFIILSSLKWAGGPETFIWHPVKLYLGQLQQGWVCCICCCSLPS